MGHAGLGVIVIAAALGVQLAMVSGALGPSLVLAFLGYAGLFAGAALIVPAALRRAMRSRAGSGPSARQ
ncbi:MAG: hypothetical protein JJT81_06880 [Rubellimicrobium sp.]|nr:hypothetical protein [Rubellimicrobium sp.]